MISFHKLTVSLVKHVFDKVWWAEYNFMYYNLIHQQNLIKEAMQMQSFQVFFKTAGSKSLDLSLENISGGGLQVFRKASLIKITIYSPY